MKRVFLIVTVLFIGSIVIVGVLINKKNDNKTSMMLVKNWDNPPVYNGNPFAPGGVGDARNYVYGKLAVYCTLDNSIKPYLAESINRKENQLIIKLKRGITWDDGVPFTSKDVKADFEFKRGWLGLQQIYDYLDTIETPDDETVVFNMNPDKKSQLAEIYILGEQIIVPFHIFGKYMETITELTELRDKKEKINENLKAIGATSKEIKNNIEYIALNDEFDKMYFEFKEELMKYKPEKPLGYGPYKVSRVTASDMILDKVETYPGNDKNNTDQLILSKWTKNEMNLALLNSGSVDIIGLTASPDVVDSLTKNENIEHIVTTSFANFGLYFNNEKYPFNDLRFRRALAYVIDRNKCREIGGYYGKTIDKQSGILESVKDIWIDDTKFESYNKNFEKAEELLNEMGMNKNSSGFWSYKDGQELDLSILSNTRYSDWILIADETARQLSDFGIKTNVRVLDAAVYRDVIINTNDYDMTIDWSFMSPRVPYEGFKRMYKGTGLLISRFNTEVENSDGNIIDLSELTDELGEEIDPKKQKEILQTLAWATNTYLPIIDYYEGAAQIFINTDRLDGEFDVEKSIPGLASDRDGNIMMWLLEGKLKTKEK